MSEFNELIKSIAKSREYVRDFYVYGFKSRMDFDKKSSRTYDNERRRIESWLAPYIKSEYNGAAKNVYLSLNTNTLSFNPLYRIFEAKSFTDNDIMLHFYLLDILHDGEAMTADELTDAIVNRYEVNMDAQTVRKKANEYTDEGILRSEKLGKKLFYSISQDRELSKRTIAALADAVSFFQMEAPLGFMGYTLMKRFGFSNDFFFVKHGYFVHALEEEILLKLLDAVNSRREVLLKIQSNKATAQKIMQKIQAYPLRIFMSTRTGRRFLCVYLTEKKRLFTLRIDHIKEVTYMSEITGYDTYLDILKRNLPKCFGISFDGSQRMDTIKMTLHIIEPYELFIVRRLETEGRDGVVTRVSNNIYTYEISVFDGNEMMPWIKTFIGRIIAFESNNEFLQTKFERDLEQMMRMYDIDTDTDENAKF